VVGIYFIKCDAAVGGAVSVAIVAEFLEERLDVLAILGHTLDLRRHGGQCRQAGEEEHYQFTGHGVYFKSGAYLTT
jgi:hypothetical protein